MGDARHQKKPSDHNLGNAFDITHDPRVGCHGDVIAAAALRDSRTKYVIWNRRIWNVSRGDTAWRRYTGDNPHTKHCHVSIRSGSRNDARPWAWGPGGTIESPSPGTTTPGPSDDPVPAGHQTYPGVPMRKRDRSEHVRTFQAGLRRRGWTIGVDGIFGLETERVVKTFQRRHGLEDDGIVGSRTWRAIFS